MSATLASRRFLVTAGGSGIGLATVRRLVKAGARVAVSDIDPDRVDAVAVEFGADAVFGIVADSGDPEQIDGCFASASAHWGGLDGLFNNAGITAPRVPLADLDPAIAERVASVNLLGTFRMMQHMLRHAADRPSVILNNSSGTALQAAPNTGFYSATKAAIISLTRTAAVEAAPHIRVNAILPGPTETPTLLAASPERKSQFLADVPLGRFGTPDEIAALAFWLLSDESSYVTGAVFTADGGVTA
ncbi:SDR family NAD(P)-dependent oxidoreductase [Microbacterium sp. A196]|uniref:SDR family NAD(P)-dependent oxidoreductase n=1 Tax=Microbacterium sp. A196 TaxID=3457320 RepID=UPI003FD48959